jgi:gliding motility-associated-like protein
LSINFAIGEATKTFFIKPKNDALVEGTETFVLRLMTNCTPSLQISSTSGTILDATNLQPINGVPIVTGPSLIYRCKNTDVVTFTARDAETYTWTSTDGTFTCLTPDCKQIRAETINTEATYNVSLKIGTCTFNQSVKVIPSFLSVTPTTLTPLCLNQTQQLTAAGMDSYTWSPATNLSCNNCPNPTFTAASAGNFTYTLTGTKGTCINTQNITFTVVPQTAPTYALADKYCVNATPVPLVGNPTGGTFTINGNPATEFNPNTLGVGNHNVSYVLGGAGCTQATNKTVEVLALPVLAWGATWKTSYCINEAEFTLAGTATPVGGTFNINGSIATSFNPTTLGAGNHNISYSYTDPTTNCNNTITRVVVVNNLTTLNFTGLSTTYCVTVGAFNLSATPTGGTFTVNGNPATQFDPSVLGVGNHSVVYTYTDANTCTNTKTQNVQVISLPTLTNNVKESYCLSSPSFTMTGTPGGTFTINGTPATQFDPATLGLGTYTVIQTYNDPASGCSNTLSKTVVINVKPTLNFVGLNNTYCVNNSSFNLNATPSGGTFTINGTAATQFNPATLGVGNHTVKYNYVSPTDAGCFNEITQVVEVNPLPQLEFTNVNNAYCVTNTNTITPSVKITLANGTIQTQNLASFVPSIVGAGTQTLTFTFIDPNTNCQNSITKNVIINPLPTLNFVNVPDKYCSEASPLTMQAAPAGGTFTINGNSTNILNPTLYAVGDILNVVYNYTDSNGCSNSISTNVEIIIPSGFTTTQQEIKICPPPTGYRIEALTQAEEDTLTGAGNILTYVWSNNAPNIRFFTIRGDGDAGTYDVEVRTQTGCPVKKIKFKVEVSCEPKLFMPTAFSPNGDGLNDTWKIFGADFSQLDLRVYNRWGEAVFITYDKGAEWDGTYNGMPLPTGTYWWKAQYENVLQKGQKIVKQGMVSIVR